MTDLLSHATILARAAEAKADAYRKERRDDAREELATAAADKLGQLLAELPDTDPTTATERATEVVASWEVLDTVGDLQLPTAIGGPVDGVPFLAIKEHATYRVELALGELVEVDGAMLLARSPEIWKLEQVPDRLADLEANVEDQRAAIADQAIPEAGPGLDPKAEHLAQQIRQMDGAALHAVADHDVETAARVMAPLVSALALDRIAYFLDTIATHLENR